MIDTDQSPHLNGAIQDFRRSRLQANVQEALAVVTGQRNQNQLLPYEEIRKKLHAVESANQKLEDIPLDAIVGSVGRYRDFTRSFLPLQNSDEQRWVRVKLAMNSLAGVPPIEVYKMGDVYFVKDGNHRVSVARQLGIKFIQAYVTEVKTKVPFTPDMKPDDLIIASEQVDFLEKTSIDTLRPDANLVVTIPGQYQKLLEHIQVHHYYMGLDEKRDVTYPEAVTHWFDTVYTPIIESIRKRGLLRGFPGRTETDMYLWLADHRAELEQELGWELRPDRVIQSASGQLTNNLLHRENNRAKVSKALSRLRDGRAHKARMVDDILVALPSAHFSWQALDQALKIARLEKATLYGVHVVESEYELESESVKRVRAEFMQRCEKAGVRAQLAVDVGEVIATINKRARWVDIVVANLVHPALQGELPRLTSNYQALLRRCIRPVLAVPGEAQPLSHALLAFDGSDKAREALFAATYIAGKWKIPLTVLTVSDDTISTSPEIAQAHEYLQKHRITAEYIVQNGPVAKTIIRVADETGSDFILMGSYKYSSMLEMMFGGVVDQVLKESKRPLFILQ